MTPTPSPPLSPAPSPPPISPEFTLGPKLGDSIVDYACQNARTPPHQLAKRPSRVHCSEISVNVDLARIREVFSKKPFSVFTGNTFELTAGHSNKHKSSIHEPSALEQDSATMTQTTFHARKYFCAWCRNLEFGLTPEDDERAFPDSGGINHSFPVQFFLDHPDKDRTAFRKYVGFFQQTHFSKIMRSIPEQDLDPLLKLLTIDNWGRWAKTNIETVIDRLRRFAIDQPTPLSHKKRVAHYLFLIERNEGFTSKHSKFWKEYLSTLPKEEQLNFLSEEFLVQEEAYQKMIKCEKEDGFFLLEHLGTNASSLLDIVHQRLSVDQIIQILKTLIIDVQTCLCVFSYHEDLFERFLPLCDFSDDLAERILIMKQSDEIRRLQPTRTALERCYRFFKIFLDSMENYRKGPRSNWEALKSRLQQDVAEWASTQIEI